MARKGTTMKPTTTSSPVRGTPIPKPIVPAKNVTREQIAQRAYEIYRSGKGGSDVENWVRAERELRGR